MNSQTMKLSTRLGLAFLAMVMLTALVGGFAVSRLAQVNAGTVEIGTNALPSIKALGDLRTTANQIRRAEADHLLSHDLAEMDGLEKKMADLKATFDTKLRDYERMVASPTEREAYEALRKQAQAYEEIIPRLIQISRGGEKTLAEARTLFRGDSRNAFNAMVADMGKVVDINDKAGAEAVATAASVYGSAIWWMVGMIVAAMAVAAVLGTWIVRSVTRQLGAEPAEAAALAARVADGDLSAPITLRSGDSLPCSSVGNPPLPQSKSCKP